MLNLTKLRLCECFVNYTLLHETNEFFPWSTLPSWCGPACFPLVHGFMHHIPSFQHKNELHLVTHMDHLIVLLVVEMLSLSQRTVLSVQIFTQQRIDTLSCRIGHSPNSPHVQGSNFCRTHSLRCLPWTLHIWCRAHQICNCCFWAHWKCAQLLPRLSEALTSASLSRLPHHVDPTFGNNSWNNRLFAQCDWPDAQRLLTNGCCTSSGAPLERTREIALHFLPPCLAPRLRLTCTVAPNSLGVGPVYSSERMRE